MSKKPVTLDGLLNTGTRPTDTGIPQRGTSHSAQEEKKQPKRIAEKRLTLALDGETYRRLRVHAAMTDQTHQDILEAALKTYLSRVST